MEAAAAYYEVTGKDRLLHVMERMAEHIGKRFGTEEGKEPGIPGHQEIELGLLRLYEVTGKENYKDLARYFIEQRGKDPDYFVKERKKRGWVHFDMDVHNREYNQAHATVYEQKEAVDTVSVQFTCILPWQNWLLFTKMKNSIRHAVISGRT